MKIEVRNIPREGGTYRFQKAAREFDVLRALEADEQCRFEAPIEFELTVTPEQDMFKVAGSLAVRVEFPCSRCLVRFTTEVRRRFTLSVSQQIPADLDSDEEEIELTAEQIGLIYFNGESIDLGDALQEQVVLALPFKPLCREDCKGLCQKCGADLNTGSCDCARENADNPFAVLKQRNWH